MVNADTQQFMYKVFIVLFAGVIESIFLYMGIVGIVQGDGEAVRIIDALQPIALGAFVSMAGVIGVHQVTAASVAKTVAQNAPAATLGVADTAATNGDGQSGV